MAVTVTRWLKVVSRFLPVLVGAAALAATAVSKEPWYVISTAALATFVAFQQAIRPAMHVSKEKPAYARTGDVWVDTA